MSAMSAKLPITILSPNDLEPNLSFFFLKIYLFYLFLCVLLTDVLACLASTFRDQKRALDPMKREFQTVASHMGSGNQRNPGPLQDQQVHFPAEPFLS